MLKGMCFAPLRNRLLLCFLSEVPSGGRAEPVRTRRRSLWRRRWEHQPLEAGPAL